MKRTQRRSLRRASSPMCPPTPRSPTVRDVVGPYPGETSPRWWRRMRNSLPARMSPHSSLTKLPPTSPIIWEAKRCGHFGLTPDGLTAFVLAYQEVAGGALTTALTPDDITAMVARYMEAEGVDLSALTPDQVEAVVSAYAEATGCDKSQLLTSFTAYITAYQEAEGVFRAAAAHARGHYRLRLPCLQ